MRFLPALLFGSLILSPQAQAYVLLDGPMPLLSGAAQPAVKPDGFAPAPLADPDAKAPRGPGKAGTTITPTLINRNANRNTAAEGLSAGSGFSEQLNRRGRSSSNIGTTLAPGLAIRQAIQ